MSAFAGLSEHIDDEDDQGVQVEEAHDVADLETEEDHITNQANLGDIAQNMAGLSK